MGFTVRKFTPVSMCMYLCRYCLLAYCMRFANKRTNNIRYNEQRPNTKRHMQLSFITYPNEDFDDDDV